MTTYYVYDPSGVLIEEWTSSANRFYYLYDGLGSVVGMTNSSRALVNTYRYDPYGNVVAQTGTIPNRWGFAGGYRDPGTGFLKFGQRYYDPTLGRWTQPAPEPASVVNPAIASPYAYVGGDPVNNVDLTGAYRVGWSRPRPSLLPTGGSGGSYKWSYGEQQLQGRLRIEARNCAGERAAYIAKGVMAGVDAVTLGGWAAFGISILPESMGFSIILVIPAAMGSFFLARQAVQDFRDAANVC